MGVQNIKIPTMIARAKSAEKSGDISSAREIYQDVLSRFPANRRARDGLAKLATRTDQVQHLLKLWRAGNAQDALVLAKTLDPKHPTVRDIRAAACRALGEYDQAITIYDNALKLEPKNPNIWFNAGAARLECSRLGEAEKYLERAVWLQGTPTHKLALAQCKLDQGYYTEAAAICADVLKSPNLTQALQSKAQNILGTSLMHLGKMDSAITMYQTAAEADPCNPECLHNLGMAHNACGDTDAAKRAFDAALKIDPKRAEIHRSVAALTQYSADHPHLATLQALLSEPIPPLIESELRFAVFKAYDDIGDVERASVELTRANAARRTALRYDAKSDQALRQRIHALTPDPVSDTFSAGPRPIFCVGLPRSGTTLTEQVLAGVPNVVAAGELPLVSQAAAAGLRATQKRSWTRSDTVDFARTVQSGLARLADPDQVIIDKMPLNFRWAKFILAALPHARIIWLQRAPLPNAFSIYKHCFAGSGNKFAYNPADIAKTMRAERDFLDTALDNAADRVHVLHLEQLRQTPEPTIRDLLQFCDLPWSQECLTPQNRDRAVLTASMHQVRQPIAAPLQDPSARYAAALPELADALEREGLLG